MPTESFFNFFNPPKAPTDDDDDDVATDIEERLELDYQLGEDIKEKLIPRGDFEDEDDEEEDDMSEDHDDEDESDDDVSHPDRIT
jgi:nucleosome assembly protein 1-like 1